MVAAILFVGCSQETNVSSQHRFNDGWQMKSETHMVDNQMVHAKGIGDVCVLSQWPDFSTHAIFSGDRVFIIRPKQDGSNDVFRGTLLSTADGWKVVLTSIEIDLGNNI